MQDVQQQMHSLFLHRLSGKSNFRWFCSFVGTVMCLHERHSEHLNDAENLITWNQYVLLIDPFVNYQFGTSLRAQEGDKDSKRLLEQETEDTKPGSKCARTTPSVNSNNDSIITQTESVPAIPTSVRIAIRIHLEFRRTKSLQSNAIRLGTSSETFSVH